jgi:myosin heavy subunit
LIGCDKKNIETALTQRTIKIRTERTQVMLNKKLATASRNALAKTLYERLFLHIVDPCNVGVDGVNAQSDQ